MNQRKVKWKSGGLLLVIIEPWAKFEMICQGMPRLMSGSSSLKTSKPTWAPSTELDLATV